MELLINKPENLNPEILEKLIFLVSEGGQIPHPERIKARILNADFVAMYLDNGNIASTATLKNPDEDYKEGVFGDAESKRPFKNYTKELGYIVTSKEYEGQKLCQNLLTEIMPEVSKHKVFATTRKPSMVHILKKNGFSKEGNTYKGDLELLLSS